MQSGRRENLGVERLEKLDNSPTEILSRIHPHLTSPLEGEVFFVISDSLLAVGGFTIPFYPVEVVELLGAVPAWSGEVYR